MMNHHSSRRLLQQYVISQQRLRRSLSSRLQQQSLVRFASSMSPHWMAANKNNNEMNPQLPLSCESCRADNLNTRSISKRLYSHYSSSSNSSIEEMESVSMRQRVATLLADTPVGSMNTDDWFQADDTIKWWASQQSVEAVHMAFQILDRLVAELRVMRPQQNHQQQPHEQQHIHNNDQAPEQHHHDDLIIYFDGNMVIPTMIESWYEVWLQQVNGKGEMELQFTPEKVLQTMDRHAADIPWAKAFSLRAKAISRLLNATNMRPEPYDQTAPFMDYLCDRLWEILPRNSILSTYKINTTLDAWAKSTRPDRVHRAESLFTRANDRKVELDLVSYNSLLSVYASEGQGQKAEELLQALVREHANHNAPAPDEITFVTVAKAIATSEEKGFEAGERTLFLVQRLLDPFDEYGRLGVPVTNILFNTVLLAFSRANDPSAGDEAYRVLVEMKNSDLAPPDAISYGTVIDAYGRFGKPDMAEKVLREQIEAFETNQDENLRPSTVTMTMIISAYSRSKDPRRVERAMQILIQMFDWRKNGILQEDPDTWTYNSILHCMKSSGRSAEIADKAESFFCFMKNRAKSGDDKARPNAWTYGDIIALFLDMGNLSKAEMYLREAYENANVELDIRIVGRYIHAVAKQGLVHKVAFWLHTLLDRCEREKGRPGTRPATSLLGAALASLKLVSKKNSGAFEKVQNLVNRFEELYNKGFLKELPDSQVYGTLINRLMKMDSVEDPSGRGLAILQKLRKIALENEAQTKRIMPDTGIYRDVLMKTIEVGRLDVAYDLFLQMLDDFKSDPKKFPRPDHVTASVLIEALSRLGTTDSWEKATSVFHQLDDTGATSDEVAFLPIRSNRCYKAMSDLARKLSLNEEAAELERVLEVRVARLQDKKQRYRKQG